jgi:hypothetical protein
MNPVVKAETSNLIRMLELYLAGEIGHEAIRDFAWSFADSSPVKPPPDEESFWSCIFTIIHLADTEHWNDGCPQRDLPQFLVRLRDGRTSGEHDILPL